MKKLSILLAGTIALAAVAAIACGGGGDDEDDGTPGANTTRTATSRTATRTSGTPGNETAAAGTPAAGETPGAASGTPGGGAPSPAGGASPAPGTTPAAGVTPGGPAADPATVPTPNQAELSGIDGVSEEDLEGAYGGNPNDPPTVVTDLPAQPAGAATDPTSIADPAPDAGGVELILDLNASEPGIQSTREINVGDVIRVGYVVANVPAVTSSGGGLAAFDFEIRYDRTRIIAPSLVGGPSIARNPDLNESDLGGGSSNWSCTPPGPEGDRDDPGSALGDGDPDTGQAFMSCFWADGGNAYASGSLVVATVTFQAVASGTVVLDFSQANAFDSLVSVLGSCGTEAEVVPCRNATLTVR